MLENQGVGVLISNQKNTGDENMDTKDCKCGGRYEMSGYNPKVGYLYTCNKCSKVITIIYKAKEK